MTASIDRSDASRVAREGYCAVAGARLYVREIGNGPPVVALHGGPDFNHNYLLPELDELSSDLRLIYYDQRGRGKSSQGVMPEDVDIDSEVDDLDRLRQHLGLDRLALLGHSWGCIVVLEFASRRPERVSHLMLLNSAPASHADFVGFREHRNSAHADTLATLRRIAATPAYLSGDIEPEAEYYRAHFASTFRRHDQLEALVGRLRSHFTAQDIVKARAIEGRLYAQTWQLPDYDLTSRLGEFRAPTLVMHGADDLIPLQCARNLADAIAGARLVVLEDCGHFTYLERPSEVRRTITDFMSR
ncbi:MAG TPA: alpha/beta fold hydrolase [Casimicrobiaceae bacterium]|nr:alpha/beta fold hydrolase [Casimicrobiaceae bacterium]